MKSLQNKNPSSVSHSQLSSTTIQKRTAFKMVPSTFEPPQQTFPESLYKNQPNLSLRTKGSKNEDNDLQSQSSVYNYNGNNGNNFNANVQFIGSLINVKDKVEFDQGDCIPIQSDDRWLVLVGEVRVVGSNGCAFGRGPGFVFFASAETKRKVKQVLAVSPVTALRLPHQTFKSQLRNYLYIKNSQKIKFLQYCPFLPQCQPYYQDIALTMQILEPIDKDQLIYQINNQANYLYWVKEGIVLLERIGKSINQVIHDFQSYYQTSCVGEDQGIVIVRKGMIFGVDGILIKEVVREVNLLDSQNPQDSTRPYQSPSPDPITLKQTRIYNAKSIGKCELYKLDKSILETYLKSTQKTFSNINSIERDKDKDKKQNQLIHFSNKELDRLCLQYTNLLMGSHSVCKEVKKKNMELDVCVDDQEMDKKRKRVEEIKMQERKMKKVGKEEGKKDWGRDRELDEFPAMIRSPRKSKAESIKRVKDVSLPSLNKKYVQNLIFKKLETKQAEKYMGYKKKVQSLIFGKDYRGEIQKLEKAQRQQKAFQTKKERVGERQNQKQKDKDKQKEKQRQKEIKKIQNVQFMKVRSYRSLLSSLG